MIEILALVVVVIALCALIGWLDWNNRKERSKLVNALIAKTPEQMRDLEFVDKVQPQKIDNTPPDLVPTEALDEEEFDEFIKGQLDGR